MSLCVCVWGVCVVCVCGVCMCGVCMCGMCSVCVCVVCMCGVCVMCVGACVRACARVRDRVCACECQVKIWSVKLIRECNSYHVDTHGLYRTSRPVCVHRQSVLSPRGLTITPWSLLTVCSNIPLMSAGKLYITALCDGTPAENCLIKGD